MNELLLGATIGLTAGISPGPLLFLTITSALRSGARAGVVVACAPLLSDVVVVTLVLVLLGQVPDTALAAIGVLGGLFMGWLGVRTWREADDASLTRGLEAAGVTWRSLRDGVVVNLLSPHPWVAWATALGPLTVAAWRDSPGAGVGFVASFYLLLVGSKTALALLAGASRHRLRDRGYRRALRLAALLLLVAGAALLVEFGGDLRERA